MIAGYRTRGEAQKTTRPQSARASTTTSDAHTPSRATGKATDIHPAPSSAASDAGSAAQPQELPEGCGGAYSRLLNLKHLGGHMRVGIAPVHKPQGKVGVPASRPSFAETREIEQREEPGLVSGTGANAAINLISAPRTDPVEVMSATRMGRSCPVCSKINVQSHASRGGSCDLPAHLIVRTTSVFVTPLRRRLPYCS